MTAPDLTLLRPLWLVAIPVVLGLGWWLSRQRGGLGDWHRATDPALMRAMAALNRVDSSPSRASLLAMVVAVCVTVLALAGPGIERREAVSFRNLDGVIFVIDTSASVTEDPRWPQMQAMARFGLAALGTRPGGVIVFAGDAYVATDMTLDHLQLGQTLSLIDGQTVPDPGSRPARGLALATQILQEAEVIAGDVVLLTDGAGLGPETVRAASAIAALGARLSVVSLHAPGAAFATHAAAGNGAVFTLADTDGFAQYLSQTARSRLEAQDFPLLFWKDMGRYVLLLALVPLLFLFRRHPA